MILFFHPYVATIILKGFTICMMRKIYLPSILKGVQIKIMIIFDVRFILS